MAPAAASGSRVRATTRRARGCRRELGLSPVIARLLAMRGLGDPEQARAVPDAVARRICTIRWRWPTWRRAVDRMLAAIARRERIAIHGDYDVDGVTSTVILRRALELLGADVVHFIPERLRDGYGLQPATHRSPARRRRRS